MVTGLIILPFLGAFLAFLFRHRATAISLVASAGTIILAGVTVAEVYQHGNAVSSLLGGWSPPLGIRLRVDGLSALMLAMAAVVGGAVSLFTPGYFSRARTNPAITSMFWPLWLFVWGTLNGLFMAADIFTLYVLMEISMLAGAALVILSPAELAVSVALRYLLVTMTGSILYLMGVAILYDFHAVLDINLLAEAIEPGWGPAVALALITIGLMTKAALFPFHFWLPPAHALAPAPVSAILSALLIKGAFYLLLRLWMELGPQSLPYEAGQIIGALAGGAMLWGSIQAMRQDRLKMLIAYSTVAQVGFFFLAFPMLLSADSASASQGWAGSAIQVTAHALAKAALFLAAGVVLMAREGEQLTAMRGLAWQLPLTAAALLLAGLGLFGPWSSGADLGKTILAESLRGDNQWWWTHLITLGSLLTAAYVLVMIRYVFHPPGNTASRAVPVFLQLIPLVLALSSLGLGWLEPALAGLLEIQAGGDS